MAEVSHKRYGFVTVSIGNGFNQIYDDLGADVLISGGQTMNPSTEDFLQAVERIPADTIFLLPNNKNVILAARQAAELIKEKQIIVIPTRNVAQGITAMINFDPTQDEQTNQAGMEEAITEVHTASTTFSIRDTHLNDMPIHKNDILGIVDGEMVEVGQNPLEVAKELVLRLATLNKDLFTIYYGEDCEEQKAQELAAFCLEQMPDCEAEVCNGGQPLYHFLISAE